jgi:hypothetical protein
MVQAEECQLPVAARNQGDQCGENHLPPAPVNTFIVPGKL